jgi:hypothetical protein
LIGCETVSVNAVGSWQRHVDVGASGNVHDMKNYIKKVQTSVTSERTLYGVPQHRDHADRESVHR